MVAKRADWRQEIVSSTDLAFTDLPPMIQHASISQTATGEEGLAQKAVN